MANEQPTMAHIEVANIDLLCTLWKLPAAMRDLLPSNLLNFVRDRYIAGVADAEATFEDHEADEDTVTGSLGQAIAMREPLFFNDFSGGCLIKISYKKVRGRGPTPPEKDYGTDGLFQISVTDTAGNTIRHKGLPFQSKMSWRGTNSKLLGQVKIMEATLGPGIAIDFSATGYHACTSEAVINARGNRRIADQAGAVKPLGQILGNDFLNCTIGILGLHFDPISERYVTVDAPLPRHLITADITVARGTD